MRNWSSGAPETIHLMGHVKRVRTSKEKTANVKGVEMKVRRGPIRL